MHTKCRVRQGPRAATLRQTTLRLLCRAQLAQSTSKSLSQNIVGKLRINKACNNKQLVATHSHAQLSDALMHTHTRPSTEAFGVAANGTNLCRKAGRFVRGMGDARATARRTKPSENGQRHASPFAALPVPGIPVPTKGHFSLSRTRVEALESRVQKTGWHYELQLRKGYSSYSNKLTTCLPTLRFRVAASSNGPRASAAAREGPRAAKEAQCVRPYVALQAPSLAARRRAIFTKPALRLGLTQGRKGMAYAQAQSTNGFCANRALRRPYGPPCR